MPERTLCMIVHAYYPLGEPRVQREARAALDDGFRVTVLCLRGEHEAAQETVDGAEVRRLPVRHRRGIGLLRAAVEYAQFSVLAGTWMAARSLRRPFDIVHVHNPPDFLVLAGLIARLRGSKLILDVHDLSSHMIDIRHSGRIGRAISAGLVWIEELSARAVQRVITVHDPYRQELCAHGIPAAKIDVVMNSVDPALVERARETEPFLPRSGSFRVIYHGSLTHWYGTDLILDAIQILRGQELEIEAVILGEGDALPSLEAQRTRADLAAHVQLSRRSIPIDQALATVATADCGVIPNRAAGINRFALSSKLFEYVALGIPVVVARLETLARYFGSEEVTFFEPDDPQALAQAIRWVYEHRDEAAEKARRAQVRAQEYDWSRSRETLLRIYAELAA